MKHARDDYKCIQDPSGKIPEDEPVFLLRGQDPLAPDRLFEWAEQLIIKGGDPHMAKIVRDHGQAMLEWQKTHPVKIPDLPTNPSKIETGKANSCSCGCGCGIINKKEKDGTDKD